MSMNLKLLDRRYKATILYIENNIGLPIYKKRCFKHIDKILGPQYTWINKNPEEYFTDNKKIRGIKAIKILNFTGSESFSFIKQNYRNLSKDFHPDKGGHSSAFDILNTAYNIFKEAYEKENTNRTF